MSNLTLHPGLGPTQADFDNTTVLNAVNPDPIAAYAHGPIPNNNPGWKPQAYWTAIANGARRYDIKVADILADPPPNQALVLNKENIGLCDIVISPPHQICGLVLPDGPSMRRHIRQGHTGALLMRHRHFNTGCSVQFPGNSYGNYFQAMVIDNKGPLFIESWRLSNYQARLGNHQDGTALPRALYQKHRIPLDYNGNVCGAFNTNPEDLRVLQDEDYGWIMYGAITVNKEPPAYVKK